jgi:glutathione synthase
MSIRLGIVMDPIAQISFKKDSSLAMLLAAQARGWDAHLFTDAASLEKQLVAAGLL